MFNNIYRLTGVRQVEQMKTQDNLADPNSVIVRPTLMSICRADERYYTGTRDKKILAKRLPMALIHEAVGEVIRDNTGTYTPGTIVAMVPNNAQGHDDLVPSNYLRNSTFSSSTADGFMREYVFIRPENLVAIPKEAQGDMNAFLEVVTVSVQAIRRLKETMIPKQSKIGIWGDGNVAYIVAVVMKEMFPDTELIVLGKHEEKLSYISFAQTMLIDEIPDDLMFDQAIEVVGGMGSESAINQMIDHANPRATLVLSGVSEENVAINTRLILEKVLDLVGTSRSTREDFEQAVELIENSSSVRDRLGLLVQNIKEINCVTDITNSFDEDLNMNWGKTVMKWNM